MISQYLKVDVANFDSVELDNETLLVLESELNLWNVIVYRHQRVIQLPLSYKRVTIKDLRLGNDVLVKGWCFEHASGWCCHSIQNKPPDTHVRWYPNGRKGCFKAYCGIIAHAIQVMVYRVPDCPTCRRLLTTRTRKFAP